MTLTGSGGIGKTRLAFQLATELQAEFADGVRLVELASLTEPALIPNAVAISLGVHAQTGQVLTDTLLEHLRAKELLLVIEL